MLDNRSMNTIRNILTPKLHVPPMSDGQTWSIARSVNDYNWKKMINMGECAPAHETRTLMSAVAHSSELGKEVSGSPPCTGRRTEILQGACRVCEPSYHNSMAEGHGSCPPEPCQRPGSHEEIRRGHQQRYGGFVTPSCKCSHCLPCSPKQS